MGLIFLNSIFFLIINQFLLIHLPVVSAASNVLRSGDEFNSLDHNSTLLISTNGKFTLQFFTIKSTNLTYLGIRYKDEVIETNVWVANRDVPMNSTRGVLMIDETGTLKVINKVTNTTLFNVSNPQVVVVGSGNMNTIAVLEDSGNFVLYDNTTRNRILLWQSFDHPTDTLLPGMKLGYNSITRQNWTLTSWFSSDQIPASGDFTLKLELFLGSPQLVINRRENLYWTSGPSDYRSSSSYGIFGRNIALGLGATFVSDASGIYIANITYHESDGVQLFIQLSSMGQLMLDKIPLMPDFAKDGFCHGKSESCVISASPGCRHQNDGFVLTDNGYIEINDVYVFLTGLYHQDNSSDISMSDCMERCWNDCKCKGFSSSNINGTGCTTWDGYEAISGTFVPKIMTYGILTSDSLKKNHWLEKYGKWIIISVVILLICACIVYHSAPWCYERLQRRVLEAKEKRRRDDYIHKLACSDSFNFSDVLEKGIKDAPDIKIFSLGAILSATNSFSTENKLGQGGYGPVYKGKLFDGREIAIKRLSKASGQGIKEFESELILISKLQHTNLVRLYGCCIHHEEKMLIYEFMPNKSLDFFLFDEHKKGIIDWRMRFNIIEGVAQGLLYLHKYSRMRVIHRDLKASNVLLDENMNPKIADFGMARNFQQNVTEEITHRIVGTYGYMAPEYAMEGTFSIKSDVFSFGVLILEIVSGRKNSRFHNLVRYAWELWKGDELLELKDASLREAFDLKQLLRTIHVGLLCVQDSADYRPNMLEVISMLNNEIADLPSPKQPLFVTGKQGIEDSSSENVPVTANGLSVTTMEAR